jgi:Family of unknown function (DUF5989)
MRKDQDRNDSISDDFSHLAGLRRRSLFTELWGFLRTNKKWWLGPVLMVFLLVGVLIVLGGLGPASFIYTLF